MVHSASRYQTTSAHTAAEVRAEILNTPVTRKQDTAGCTQNEDLITYNEEEQEQEP
jgi:hypothetical protein